LALTEIEARAALEGILDRLGVQAGDRIMLGIDMGRLPLPAYTAALSREAFRERERKWCQFVLDVLTGRLGASGTLLAPSFTYSCSKPGSIFVAASTPSENGPFTEFFRSQSQAVRSLHPIFSVSGIGRDAEAILHNVGRSAFGAMSPFSRFAGHGVRFLCLGVELRNCITYIHHLEQSYGCPHRYNKSFDIQVTADTEKTAGEWYAYVGYRGIDYASDIASLQHALKAKGSLVEAEWNGHPNHLAEIAAVDSVGYELLTKDCSAFVNRRLKLRFDDSASANSNNTEVSSLIVTASERN
jgi:aminoglycoside 3-N-acetyltransferase